MASRLDRPRRGQSLSNWLRKSANLSSIEIALLREAWRDTLAESPLDLARQIKSIPFRLTATQPIGRAISTAGGIVLAELDANLMLVRLPGVFAAGEMLDWEAPTGGYLLQACFSTGVAAAQGILHRLRP
jgi:predicted flavoprotein YhiN